MKEVTFLLSGEIAYFELARKFGDQFESAFDDAVDLLKHYPEMAPVFEIAPFRRQTIPGTMWGVFYTIEGSRIVISTILDLRQDPERIVQTLKNLLPE